MDSAETIHARSERLVACLGALADGEMDMETMEMVIDTEEAHASISRKDFFDSVRKLARKIEVD